MRSIHTSNTGVKDYQSYVTIWHWDQEGIPFQMRCTEDNVGREPESTIAIDLYPESVTSLVIRDPRTQEVLFELNPAPDGDAEYDRKRDDELTEVEA